MKSWLRNAFLIVATLLCTSNAGKFYRIVWVTAYTSRQCETDKTPYITASNKRVRDGVVACNFLRFGTKIQFPDLFGKKIFVVEDRMARRKKNHVDIWFKRLKDARRFGKKRAVIKIITNEDKL